MLSLAKLTCPYHSVISFAYGGSGATTGMGAQGLFEGSINHTPPRNGTARPADESSSISRANGQGRSLRQAERVAEATILRALEELNASDEAEMDTTRGEILDLLRVYDLLPSEIDTWSTQNLIGIVKDRWANLDSALRESNRIIAEQDSALKCVVCLDARKEYAFWPCRHGAVCGSCRDNPFFENNRFCPICRQDFTHFERIFM